MFKPRAFCYVEARKEVGSNGASVYYIFRPTLASTIRTGLGGITTTDRVAFDRTVDEMRGEGWRISDRPPFYMPSATSKTESFECEGRKRFRVKRVPYGSSILSRAYRLFS